MENRTVSTRPVIDEEVVTDAAEDLWEAITAWVVGWDSSSDDDAGVVGQVIFVDKKVLIFSWLKELGQLKDLICFYYY